MKKITTWTKIEKIRDEKGKVIGEKENYNHFSDGWSEGEFPTPFKPEYANQKAWKQSEWKKTHAYLNDNKIVYSTEK